MENPYKKHSEYLAAKWEEAVKFLGDKWVCHRQYTPTEKHRHFWAVGKVNTGEQNGSIH